MSEQTIGEAPSGRSRCRECLLPILRGTKRLAVGWSDGAKKFYHLDCALRVDPHTLLLALDALNPKQKTEELTRHRQACVDALAIQRERGVKQVAEAMRVEAEILGGPVPRLERSTTDAACARCSGIIEANELRIADVSEDVLFAKNPEQTRLLIVHCACTSRHQKKDERWERALAENSADDDFQNYLAST